MKMDEVEPTKSKAIGTQKKKSFLKHMHKMK